MQAELKARHALFLFDCLMLDVDCESVAVYVHVRAWRPSKHVCQSALP